jgi:hypothetical protein
VRWTLLVKLAPVALGAWIVHVAVGNLCWSGLIRTPLSAVATSAIGAVIFVLAAVLVEISPRGGVRAWARWALWSALWLVMTGSSVRVRPDDEAGQVIAKVVILGPPALVAVVMAWRRWPKRRRATARLLNLDD